MTAVQINNHFSLPSTKAIERRTVKEEQEWIEEERNKDVLRGRVGVRKC